MIALTRIERALDITARMLQARAAAQTIWRDRYHAVVKGYVDDLREKKLKSGKEIIEIVCDLAERETHPIGTLAILAAAIELIEEEARCGGVA